MTNTSQDSVVESEILFRAHRILDNLGDDTVFASYDEFRLHASAFFVATLQLKLKLKFPNVNRSPKSFEDHCFNAQIFIDAAQKYLHTSLREIEPELICKGDYKVILKCIKVIESIDNSNISTSKVIHNDDTHETISNGDHINDSLLRSWNHLMAKFQLPKLATLNELQVNASSITTLIVEAVLGKRLKGVVRRPLLRKDYSNNARVAMEAICIYSGKELDSAQLAEQLVSGDATVLAFFPKLISLVPKCANNDVKINSKKAIKSRPSAPSRDFEHHLKTLNQDELLQRQKVVVKQLKALTARSQAETESVIQHASKNLSRRHRHEQIWTARQDEEFLRDETTLQRLHNESFQYEVCRTFAKALKLEKEYQRVQYAAFTQRLKQLVEQWNNKKISTKRFFNDKYEMFLTDIKHAAVRRKSDEIQARIALIKKKNELRTEHRKRLDFLKQNLLEKDRNATFIEPQKLLKWLLKIPAH